MLYRAFSGHLICMEKIGKLCRNFQQYYGEESGDYVEKTPDHAEISKIFEDVPFVFQRIKYMLTSY